MLAARSSSVVACSVITWKLAPIAAGRRECSLEGLSDIVGVHLVQDAEPKLREGQGSDLWR